MGSAKRGRGVETIHKWQTKDMTLLFGGCSNTPATRNNTPLLFKENISYGFRRNCYGIKWLSVILALLPLAAVFADLIFDATSYIDINAPDRVGFGLPVSITVLLVGFCGEGHLG
jgi:hypothetical protein